MLRACCFFGGDATDDPASQPLVASRQPVPDHDCPQLHALGSHQPKREPPMQIPKCADVEFPAASQDEEPSEAPSAEAPATLGIPDELQKIVSVEVLPLLQDQDKVSESFAEPMPCQKICSQGTIGTAADFWTPPRSASQSRMNSRSNTPGFHTPLSSQAADDLLREPPEEEQEAVHCEADLLGTIADNISRPAAVRFEPQAFHDALVQRQ